MGPWSDSGSHQKIFCIIRYWAIGQVKYKFIFFALPSVHCSIFLVHWIEDVASDTTELPPWCNSSGSRYLFVVVLLSTVSNQQHSCHGWLLLFVVQKWYWEVLRSLLCACITLGWLCLMAQVRVLYCKFVLPPISQPSVHLHSKLFKKL